MAVIEMFIPNVSLVKKIKSAIQDTTNVYSNKRSKKMLL